MIRSDISLVITFLGAFILVGGLSLIPISFVFNNADINYPAPVVIGIGIIIVCFGIVLETFCGERVEKKSWWRGC